MIITSEILAIRKWTQSEISSALASTPILSSNITSALSAIFADIDLPSSGASLDDINTKLTEILNRLKAE